MAFLVQHHRERIESSSYIHTCLLLHSGLKGTSRVQDIGDDSPVSMTHRVLMFFEAQ